MNLSTGKLMGNESLTNPSINFSPTPLSARIAKISACCLVLVFALVGNILIITVVHRNSNMRKTINYFIVNMAVSDLVVPIVILPRVIVEIATDSSTWWAVEGIAGNVLCKVMYFVSDLTMVVSILSLICITVDRFCAVVFPMRLSLITSKVRIGLIVFTWLFSVVFFAVYFHGFKIFKVAKDTKPVCILEWSESFNLHVEILQAFTITSCILFVLIPCIVLSIMYTVILVVARMAIVSRHEQRGTSAKSRRKSTNSKLLKLALLTVSAFAFCYGPYNVFLFYATFIWSWDIKDPEAFKTFLFVAQFLTYLNSALNPCLYFIFIENYRRGLKRVLSQASRRNGKNLNPRATRQSNLDTESHPPNKYLELEKMRAPLTSSEDQNSPDSTKNPKQMT